MKKRNFLPAAAVMLLIFISLGLASAAATDNQTSTKTISLQSTHTAVSTVSTKPAIIWTKYLHKNGTIGTTLRLTDIGFVQKWGVFGNTTSKNKVGIILGVHPQEANVHQAMWAALNLSPNLKNCKIYVYRVYLGPNQNAANRDVSRVLGQNIANKLVVPDIDKSYKLVIDVHGNQGSYYTNGVSYKNFIFAPSNRTASKSYAFKIINKVNPVSKWMQLNKNGTLYNPPSQTSPKYVTLPIASKGVPALVLELYKINTITQASLVTKCTQILNALNKITYV